MLGFFHPQRISAYRAYPEAGGEEVKVISQECMQIYTLSAYVGDVYYYSVLRYTIHIESSEY